MIILTYQRILTYNLTFDCVVFPKANGKTVKQHFEERQKIKIFDKILDR
jgi:hypothetical protein